MGSLQYLHTRRSGKKASEKSEQGEDNAWKHLEQIAKVAAQFAAALAVVFGLLGAVISGMAASYILGLEEAKGVTSIRFTDLTASSFTRIGQLYSMFAGSNFLVILAVLGGPIFISIILIIVLLWFGEWIAKQFAGSRIGGKWLSISILGLFAIVVTIVNARAQFEPQKLGNLMTGLLWSVTFWVAARNLKGRWAIMSLLWAVFFTALLALDVLGLSLSGSAYISKSLGWAYGVRDICESPQIVPTSQRASGMLSEERNFLLLRAGEEYYVFTDTIPITLPAPSPEIKWFVNALMPSLPFTLGCSPISVTILPAADMGDVMLIYDNQIKPGNCCYQLLQPSQ